MFELINNLEMAHHSPGQPVIKQNENIMNDKGEFIEDEAHMYFIVAGNYKVMSM